MQLRARGHILTFPRRPLIMGIVNLSTDSFSGDGLADVDAAVEKAHALLAEGADIIDVGAESARTNRGAISEQEEIDRLCAFVARWEKAGHPERSAARRAVEGSRGEGETPAASAPRASRGPSTAALRASARDDCAGGEALLSINTWRPTVARAVLREGGDLLNDIGGLPTDENARICAEAGAALLIMHSVGEPKVAHTHVGYRDVMDEMDAFFAGKIALAEKAGLPREAIVLDPGIDFAKQRDDNLRIYRELARLHRFERPLLLPISRKTVIGDVLGVPAPERDAGTVACLVAGMLRGAQIFRVHNVRAAAQAVRVIEAVVG